MNETEERVVSPSKKQSRKTMDGALGNFQKVLDRNEKHLDVAEYYAIQKSVDSIQDIIDRIDE